MFHLLPILSKYFTGKPHLIKALPPKCRRTGRKFLRNARAARSRTVNQHLGIDLPSIGKPKGCEGAISRAKSERVRGKRTRTFSGAAPRTYQEHNLELLSRDCFCARLRSSGARTFWSSVRQLDLANSSSSTRPALPPISLRMHGTLPARTVTGPLSRTGHEKTITLVAGLAPSKACGAEGLRPASPPAAMIQPRPTGTFAQRFENWKLRRAFLWPYFLRSTTRESRVRKPSFLSAGRRSGS